jgi:hypothetical protein
MHVILEPGGPNVATILSRMVFLGRLSLGIRALLDSESMITIEK